MKRPTSEGLRVTSALMAFIVATACAKKEPVRKPIAPKQGINAGSDNQGAVNPPRELRVVGTHGLQVNLAWKPAGEGQQAQRIERSEDQSSWHAVQNLDGTAAEASDTTDLAPSTLYYYRVLAIYEKGTSPSNVVAALTPDGNASASPTPTPTNVVSTLPGVTPTQTPTDVVVATPTPTNATIDSQAVTVSNLNPQFGDAGTAVSVTGTNLNTVSAVILNGVTIIPNSVFSTSLVFTIPDGATSGTPALLTPNGNVSTGYNFYVPPGTPTISSFSPMSGPAGTIVTVYGTHLDQVSQIYMGSVSVPQVTKETLGRWMTIQIPAGAQTNPISITRNIGTLTTNDVFSVTTAQLPKPSINSISVGPNSKPNDPEVDLRWDPGTGHIVQQLDVNGTWSNYQVQNETYLIGALCSGMSVSSYNSNGTRTFTFRIISISSTGERSVPSDPASINF